VLNAIEEIILKIAPFNKNGLFLFLSILYALIHDPFIVLGIKLYKSNPFYALAGSSGVETFL
jgi:hypothetical protein